MNRTNIIWASLALAMLFRAMPGMAQSSAEVFGAYSWARQGEANIGKGWAESTTWFLNRKFGIEGDISGHRYSRDLVNFPRLPRLWGSVNYFTVSGGPKFAFPFEGSVTPFVHGLVGGAWSRASGNLSYGDTTVTVAQDAGGISVLYGGGLDIGKGLIGFRAQADGSLFDSGVIAGYSHGVRLSSGIVIRIR